jgi:hypothetical protein
VVVALAEQQDGAAVLGGLLAQQVDREANAVQNRRPIVSAVVGDERVDGMGGEVVVWG